MEQNNSTLRNLVLKLTAFTIVGLFTLTAGELAVRALIYIKSKTYPTQTTKVVKKIGWEPKKDFHFTGMVPDATGNTYSLDYYTDTLGFRAFGKLDSKKKKIFYIGDSFTQSIEVSNDKTFYALAKNQFDLETFAYGSRGHSTLQEYMILDQYHDQIQPDILVLQFCYNDFINNSFELESNSIYNNNRRLRPYLDAKGKTVEAYPSRIPFRWLNDNSMLCQLLFTTIEKVWNTKIHKKNKTTEAYIADLGLDYIPFAESISTTKTLLQTIQNRINKETDLVILYVGAYDDPYYKAFESICEELCISFISEASQHPLLNNNDKSVMAKDHFHWNEKGHEIAAEALIEYLRPLIGGNGVNKISSTEVISSAN